MVFKAAIIKLDKEELFVIFDYITHISEEELDEFIEVAKEIGGKHGVEPGRKADKRGQGKGHKRGHRKGHAEGRYQRQTSCSDKAPK